MYGSSVKMRLLPNAAWLRCAAGRQGFFAMKIEL
jgi:hypothetical protein